MNIEADETPLQKKLNGIAEGIGKLGLTVAILTLIAIITKTIISAATSPPRYDEDDQLINPWGIDFW